MPSSLRLEDSFHLTLPHSSSLFQAELDDKMPSSLRLEDECRGLSELLLRGGFSSGGSVDPVEMPGQYLAGNEVWTGGRGSGGR